MELKAPGARYSTAFTVSALSHVAAVLLLAMIGARVRPSPETTAAATRLEHPEGIVWLARGAPREGTARGGGGGGDRSQDPARRLEMRGRDSRSLPVATSAAVVEPATSMEDPSVQPLDLSAVGMARGVESRPGALTGLSSVMSVSRGPGRDGGAGEGQDRGIGPGLGPGLGPGERGHTGGDIHEPGGGVTDPLLVREVKPRYTEHAMRARIQGVVALDAVVTPDGGVGSIRIVRSLDRTFGLDREAIEAVRQWRFKPGLLAGEPVAVLVRIELSFMLQ